jgi:hypothetical protein
VAMKLVPMLIAVVYLMVMTSCDTMVPSSPSVPTPTIISSPPSAISTSPSLTSNPTAKPNPWPAPSHGFSTPALPPLSSDDQEAVDQSIVMVWGSDGNYATGVVIGDGNQVLTTWDFEASKADGFKIMAPGGIAYESSIQAFDSRTALMLLQTEGMKIPAAHFGDILTIKTGQEVVAREWHLPGEFSKVQLLTASYTDTFPHFFSVHYPMEVIQANQVKRINQGAIVTDMQGNLLGIVGVDYMTLMPHPHPSPFVPSVAGVIPAAGVLSSNTTRQLWENGPLQIIIANQSGTRSGGYLQNYDAVTQAIKELENDLGASLAASELKEYQGNGATSSDGITVTAAYAWPVNLLSSDGKLLTSARWVGIQWNRSNNTPNRLFYGSKISTVDGGFLIAGDITALDQAFSPLIPNGTVTAPTPR